MSRRPNRPPIPPLRKCRGCGRFFRPAKWHHFRCWAGCGLDQEEQKRVVQCDGKVRWSTKARAKKRRNPSGGSRLDVYRCPHCRGWHLGNPPKEREG